MTSARQGKILQGSNAEKLKPRLGSDHLHSMQLDAALKGRA
jgi:hypothetical protein